MNGSGDDGGDSDGDDGDHTQNKQQVVSRVVQLSIFRIAGYGPWTLTLGSDREHALQMLQAALYREAQQLLSERGCLLFQNRGDELVALSTGLDLDGHAAIRDLLSSRFDVPVRVSIGRGPTPAAADRAAHSALATKAETLSTPPATTKTTTTTVEGRSGLNRAPDGNGLVFGPAGREPRPGQVTIMHMDVDGLSHRRASPYETSLLIFGLYHKMSAFFYELESLAFFMGGDNFMIAASDEAVGAARKFVDMTDRQDGIRLNCGIGRGDTGREAARLATESLDMIRRMRGDGDGDGGDDPATAHAAARPDKKKAGPRVYEHATRTHL